MNMITLENLTLSPLDASSFRVVFFQSHGGVPRVCVCCFLMNKI
jgi:hypothetical protein